MSTQVMSDADTALAHLERLTDELRARGWNVEVSAPDDRWPCALVSDPSTPAMDENVIAARDRSGDTWSYFHGWGERIAPCSDPAEAAAVLGRVLASRRSN